MLFLSESLEPFRHPRPLTPLRVHSRLMMLMIRLHGQELGLKGIGQHVLHRNDHRHQLRSCRRTQIPAHPAPAADVVVLVACPLAVLLDVRYIVAETGFEVGDSPALLLTAVGRRFLLPWGVVAWCGVMW